MEFEFDNRKSQLNKKKHGIDFIEAQVLWNDPDRAEIPAKTIDEERSLIIGKNLINAGRQSSNDSSNSS